MSRRRDLRGACFALGVAALALFAPHATRAQAPGAPAAPANADADLETRREALREGWVFEPVAIEGTTYRFYLGRHDGSFFFENRRSGVRWHSRPDRPGFASVRLRDGRALVVDRVEALDAATGRVRFRGASSEGALPTIRFELRDLAGTGGLALSYLVPPESQPEIARVTLLDRALWATDADAESGVAIPSGDGEWIENAGAPIARRLSGFPLDADPSDRTSSYSLAALVVEREGTPLVVRWTSPEIELEVSRGPAFREAAGTPSNPTGTTPDRRALFPGKDGIFVSLSSAEPAAEVELHTVVDLDLGPFEGMRRYRALLGAEIETTSLRRKAADRPELQALGGALVMRASIGAPSASPLAPRTAARRFDDIARLAGRLRETLEIDEALFLLEDWLDDASDLEQGAFEALGAAGGADGLRALRESLGERGYLLGLVLDRPQLHSPTSNLVEAWRRSVEFAAGDHGFARLSERYRPGLVLLREQAPATTDGLDWETLADLHGRLGPLATEHGFLLGASPASRLDASSAAYLEGGVEEWTDDPIRRETFPFLASILGDSARLVSRRGALGPRDVRAFLALLLLGEIPAYALPDEDAALALAAPDAAAFSSDDGWSRGRELSPHERFVKNTYEVAAPLARLRARTPLTIFRTLSDDGAVRESWFGADLRVVVNLSDEDYLDEDTSTVLPPLGLLVRHPFYRAFHARSAEGVEYDPPALFTVQSLEGKMFLRAEQVRLYRGFGPREIRLGGKTFEVDQVLITKIW